MEPHRSAGYYEQRVEVLVREQMAEQLKDRGPPESQLHDEVAALVSRRRLREVPAQRTQNVLEGSERVDLQKYNVSETTSLDSLKSADSYLAHQQVVLEGLLPRTLANQWATNNDYMVQVIGNVRAMNAEQEGNINAVRVHREAAAPTTKRRKVKRDL
ncbi:Snt309p KNAG_0A07500 [Huiozyma naganishii CBS 8797]|uniref:Uncharacterized protein n=1 Tax=Huiozyma naganishii (strain ATCC MYA-139 / BCRC 22969 / CBS 8797 / KCTC 17520 / NBRC 10181 / NCYC 3082 / Yp74L-3) TaxID=1071383 RepID=J7RFT4_HUIN7|nr:hypothetical protein KNAG_0A07500 [Kazachstania naganishii CBS 8797]CCK68403.1 hypothetical protein KNAG_0A07500 [Kazachstania naganishii CBS 8797]